MDSTSAYPSWSPFCVSKTALNSPFTATVEKEKSYLCCDIVLPFGSKERAKLWEEEKVQCVAFHLLPLVGKGIAIRGCHLAACFINSLCCVRGLLICFVGTSLSCCTLSCALCAYLWTPFYECKDDENHNSKNSCYKERLEDTRSVCAKTYVNCGLLTLTTALDIIKFPFRMAFSEILYAYCKEADTDLWINQTYKIECLNNKNV